MSDTLAKYSFLPWFRQGLGQFVEQPDSLQAEGLESQSGRSTFPISVRIKGNGKQVKLVDKDFQLIGAGDINGINPQAVIKTEPTDGLLKFEPNYLPYIEFYDEDFPWRYSPATAAGTNKTNLRPWLALIVLEASEFSRSQSTPLPIIHLTAGAENGPFPNASQSHYWAHVQVNQNIKAETDSINLERDTAQLQSDLDRNANIASSRILCPRKLKAQTRYFAFLIPTFEQGRRAGLGMSETDIYSVNPQMSSWGLAHTVLPDQYPVYYEFGFQTGQGDFEELVKALRPYEADSALGQKPMSIHNPTFELPFAQSILMEGALKTVNQRRKTFGASDYKEQLKNHLNLTYQYLTDPTTDLKDDPMILPPIYGYHYSSETQLSTKGRSWLHEMNLDPRNRAAAGLGTKVVQNEQESFMEQAWEQAGDVVEANQKLRQAQLAEESSKKLFSKYIKALPDANILAITQAVHGKLRMKDSSSTSIQATVKDSALPNGMLHQNFKKLTVKAGKSKRLKSQSSGPPSSLVITQAFRRNYNSRPLLTPLDIDTSIESRSISLSKVKPVLDTFSRRPTTSNRNRLTRSSSPLQFGKTKSTLGVRDFQVGVDKIVSSFDPGAFQGFQAGPALQIGAVSSRLVDLLDPSANIRRKTWGRIDRSGSSSKDLSNIRVYPEIKRPMYESLKKISLDHLIPNIHLIPEDSVLLLQTNDRFIESYMMGLNHEMGRELLWREYPTDQQGSYFRHFWNTADADTPRADVRELHRWGKQRLGNNQPFGTPSSMLVFVIRSAIVSRYPSFISYLSPARKFGSKRRFDSSEKNILEAEFRADISRDICLMGFDAKLEDLNTHPGYYFVIKERPGESRFGLDTDSSISSFFGVKDGNDLAWPHLERRSAYASLNNSQHISLGRKKTIDQYKWGEDAAHMAGLLYQNPVIAAIHCSELF